MNGDGCVDVVAAGEGLSCGAGTPESPRTSFPGTTWVFLGGPSGVSATPAMTVSPGGELYGQLVD